MTLRRKIRKLRWAGDYLFWERVHHFREYGTDACKEFDVALELIDQQIEKLKKRLKE